MPRKTPSSSPTNKGASKKAPVKKHGATPDKKTAGKASPHKRTPARSSTHINPSQRHRMIEVAAYYIAEKRGFSGTDPLQDWFRAEHEVDELLNANHLDIH